MKMVDAISRNIGEMYDYIVPMSVMTRLTRFEKQW